MHHLKTEPIEANH